MFKKLLVSTSFAALLMVVPAAAQDSQGQGTGGQGGQDSQILMQNQNQGAQPQGGDAGQAAGAQQQPDQAQPAGEQGQAADQKQQTTGEQPAAEGQATGGESGTKVQQTQQGDQPETTGTTSRAATELPAEQRTVIRERIISRNVPRVERDSIDFDINVGVAVPGTVALQPLPPDIIEVVPAYRGYNYFVLADGTIVIVDPATLQIVYVLAG